MNSTTTTATTGVFFRNGTATTTLASVSSPAAVYKTILVICGGSILSLLTTFGNLLVLISFRINKQLRTVTNYFLLSLAIADFTIGFFSMPIFFAFFGQDRWPFDSFLCNVWLSVDYTMSNASVANLLLICFDRYLSITRPLTYRGKRTPQRAFIMIACGWTISCLIWTPWIWAWPLIDKRLPPGECRLPFASKATVAVPTAIAAFYLPVTLMCLLYFRIYRKTVRRRKELHFLQAQNHDSCPTTTTTHSNGRSHGAKTTTTISGIDPDETMSTDSNRSQHKIISTSAIIHGKKQILTSNSQRKSRSATLYCCQTRCCDTKRNQRDDDESSSEIPPLVTTTMDGRPDSILESLEPTKTVLYADPWIRRCDQPPSSSIDYPFDQQQQQQHPSIQYETRPYYHRSLTSTFDEHLCQHQQQRQPLLGNVDKDIEYVESRLRGTTTTSLPLVHSTRTVNMNSDVSWRRSNTNNNNNNNNCTILPTNSIVSVTSSPHEHPQPTALTQPKHAGMNSASTSLPQISETAGSVNIGAVKSTNAKSTTTPLVTHTNESIKTVKRRIEKVKDQKAARTLSAVLIAFIVTWLPYNTNIIISTIYPDIFQQGFPMYWERFGYMLCYLNSTINPMLYALCNGTFRRTFARILRCQFHKRHTITHMQKAYRFQAKKIAVNAK